MTSTIRAKQIVESPLPSLQIGPYHTVSSALQRLSFEETLILWSNFLACTRKAKLDEVKDITLYQWPTFHGSRSGTYRG